MTKVYLVKVQYLSKENIWYDVVKEVFTNKRKALSYQRYLEAKGKLIESRQTEWWILRSVSIDTTTISNQDWSKDALELEMELLPY